MSNCRSPWRTILPAPVPGLVIRYSYNCAAASTWRARGGAAQGEEISAKGDGLGDQRSLRRFNPSRKRETSARVQLAPSFQNCSSVSRLRETHAETSGA